MIIEVKDNKIFDAFPKELNIETQQQKFRIFGKFPSDSIISVFVNGLPWEHTFILDYIETGHDGNHFQCIWNVPTSIQEYIKSNPHKRLFLNVFVNGILIEGKIVVKFDFKKLIKDGNQIIENDFKVLQSQIKRLEDKVNKYISGHYVEGFKQPEGIPNLQEGMVPILLDSQGRIKFDYIHHDLERTIVKFAEVSMALEEIVEKHNQAITDLQLEFQNLKNGIVI